MVGTQASACSLNPSLIFHNDQLSNNEPQSGISRTSSSPSEDMP